MSATINTNLASLNAQRNTSASQGSLMVSMQRLSSGLRVNSAKDDAAGLAIAERMNTQVRGMSVAIRNANDGISFAQTAEGALGKIGDMLQHGDDDSVRAADSTQRLHAAQSLLRIGRAEPGLPLSERLSVDSWLVQAIEELNGPDADDDENNDRER